MVTAVRGVGTTRTGSHEQLVSWEGLVEEFNGRTAVVTGGGSGLGRALALRWGALGMNVVVVDIDEARAADVAEELRQDGGEAIAVGCDVADAAAVDALAERSFAEFGSVHVLCNNAGVFVKTELPEAALPDWRWMIDVNLYGVVHALHSFLPRMRARGEPGHVVNTASFGGIVAAMHDGIGAYVASKYALVGLSEQLRSELRADGFGVTVVCPTGMPTRIHEAGRHRPDGVVASELDDTTSVRRAMDQGMDPFLVADMTVDAVRHDRLYVINDASPRVRELVARRFTEIVDSFEHAAGPDRAPRAARGSREAVEAFLRGDFAVLADDAAVWLSGAIPGGTTDDIDAGSSGETTKAGLLAMHGRLVALAASPFRLTPTGWTVDGERVAVEAQGHVVLRSGRTYANRYNFAFVVRNGLIVDLREYSDTALIRDVFS
jgi:NAD(P)-dependent dehydrogenase (short-subunit alcohol dehydrogenase family)